jgi:regulator of protease activity HflC (stomatin/prohibitin superfamily)
MQKFKFGIISVVVVALLGFYLVTASFFTIESGTVGVLSTFGEYSEEEAQPGLHWKIPVVQKVRVFDTKMQTVNYFGRQDAPDEDGVINKPQITVLDDKNLQIGTDLTVQYTPIPDRASEILAVYGQNYFDKKLNAIIRNIVRDIAGKYQAETIASERERLGEEIAMRLNLAFTELPFKLNEVALRNLVLPRIVTEKIEQVQQAKQEEQRLAMVERQAQQEQLIKTTQANTRLIEVTTQAKAEAEKRKIQADAKAYAILKEAEAIAEANKKVAKSITNVLVQYNTVEKWNGVMPQTVATGGNKVAPNILLGVGTGK